VLPELIVVAFLLLTLVGMVALTHLGRRVGARRNAFDPDGSAGTGAVEGAVFALMTLLVAFTFSGAATRFAARRALIVDEGNAVGTAYLRLDLLPPALQPPLRASFRGYVDSRIAAYAALPDLERWTAELERSNALQRRLWDECVAALAQVSDPRAALLLLPPLNEMIDLTTARAVALRTHPSPIIFALLELLALACAFVAGLGMAKTTTPNRLHIYGFAVLVVLTLAVILDFEYPRIGLIRIDAVDAVLVDARARMN
jgi:hypothetical protein